MALQTRAIKRRIKSVRNTRKITKAMELVAGSKMRKAVSGVLGTRPYARLAWDTVLKIGSVTDTASHPLLKRHDEATSVLVILITSDRGLAGGFNANMIRRTVAEITSYGADVRVDTITIGKRGADAMRRAGKPILASFTDVSNNPKFEDVLPIGRMVVGEYAKGTYRKVVVAYTDFVSAIAQRPIILDLLPLGKPDDTRELGEVRSDSPQLPTANPQRPREYTFEPSPLAVLDRMLPRLVETMVYQAVLESSASEHSSRMLAMRNASDSASEMIDALTFTFNQARQAGITQEIAEISSGKAALDA